METTCVYFHVNKVKQEIFYVGIGFSERPYQKKSRSKWWKALTAAYDYEAIVIHENLTWEKACELEKFYIAQIGRRDQNNGTLINLTDGGDGVFGRILSDKQRQRISELNAEREWTEEARAKISAIHKGKIVSEEQREKLRQKMLGKKLGKLTDSHKNT